MDLGPGVAVLNTQVVPISQVVLKTGFTVITTTCDGHRFVRAANSRYYMLWHQSVSPLVSIAQPVHQIKSQERKYTSQNIQGSKVSIAL